nr:MAG TPA: hypothetical protein [Caudoviricetes sp.]
MFDKGEFLWVRGRYSSAEKKRLPPSTVRWPRTGA